MFFDQWKEVLIDPGVYELTKSPTYSWEKSININEFLDSLPDNHYFSFDYPCDMNLKYTDLFLEKSWNNALLYNCHPQYITTVQSQFNHYWWFVNWFDKYNLLYNEGGSQIMGLGNLCRIHHLTEYIKHSLDYAFSHTNYPRIHIYGLCMKAIAYAYKLAKRYNIEFSFDSTKWTRCYHTSGLPSCNKSNRQQYFNEYKNEILRRCKYEQN